jgi:hypothetical protein
VSGPLYGLEFSKIFCISCPRFQRLLEDFGNSKIPFFDVHSDFNDYSGPPKVSLEAKLLYSLKSLAYDILQGLSWIIFNSLRPLVAVASNNFAGAFAISMKRSIYVLPPSDTGRQKG